MKQTHTMESARRRVGLKQSEMAKKLGVSEPTYISYELGKTDIKARTLFKFCEITGVDINDIYLPNISS